MMRIAVTIALVLSLINLGLFVWQLWPEPEPRVRAPIYDTYSRFGNTDMRIDALERRHQWDDLRGR